MGSKVLSWLGSVTALASVLFSQTTVADEILDEIVVSADFRERSLLEVPFSVSVLGGVPARYGCATFRRACERDSEHELVW